MDESHASTLPDLEDEATAMLETIEFKRPACLDHVPGGKLSSSDRPRATTFQQWVADCQSGMYVNCVYCGHRYGPQDTTPVSMAEMLKTHIAACPRHPMAKLLKCCVAADHAYSSLLAVRDGITDALLVSLQNTTRAAIAEAERTVTVEITDRSKFTQ